MDLDPEVAGKIGPAQGEQLAPGDAGGDRRVGQHLLVIVFAHPAVEKLGKAIDIFKECGADGWVEKYEKEIAEL